MMPNYLKRAECQVLALLSLPRSGETVFRDNSCITASTI
jgi:hypothetical protein